MRSYKALYVPMCPPMPLLSPLEVHARASLMDPGGREELAESEAQPLSQSIERQ